MWYGKAHPDAQKDRLAGSRLFTLLHRLSFNWWNLPAKIISDYKAKSSPKNAHQTTSHGCFYFEATRDKTYPGGERKA